MTRARHNRRWGSWLLGIGWVACCLYVWTTLDHGWIPHDEGTLAQAAARVASGELPHRDFDDVYTGGQALVHSVVLRVRDDLMGPRILLFGFFVIWIPTFYWIARRFAGPAVSAASTALSAALGLPLYPAAMPSWYNLYFATFGLAALLAWMESGRRTMLFMAGLTGGLSVLAKVSGLYFIAASLVAIAVREVVRPSEPGTEIAFPLILSLGAATLIAVVFRLVGPHGGFAALLHFVLPIAAVSVLLVAWTWRLRTAPAFPARVGRLSRDIIPYAAGCLLPIVVFLIPYASSGSVGALLNGVFVLPGMRFEFATRPPPRLQTAIFLPPLCFTFVLAELLPRAARRAGAVALFLLLCVFVWSSRSRWGYLASWFPLYYLPALSVLAGAVIMGLRLARGRITALDISALSRVLVILFVAALCSLIQFPYAGSIYLAYVAPLSILALLAALSMLGPRTGWGTLTVFPYLTLFLILRAHPGTIRDLGYTPGLRVYTERLQLERGGILVTLQEKIDYETAVTLLQAHARGRYILSAPDCPELYYLAGFQNPTRHLFEFFHGAATTDDDIWQIVNNRHLTAIAINETPDFSPRLSEETRARLSSLLPSHASVGKFTVRWAP